MGRISTRLSNANRASIISPRTRASLALIATAERNNKNRRRHRSIGQVQKIVSYLERSVEALKRSKRSHDQPVQRCVKGMLHHRERRAKVLSVYDAPGGSRAQRSDAAIRREESKNKAQQGFLMMGKSRVAEGDKENGNGNERVEERGGVRPGVPREKEGE